MASVNIETKGTRITITIDRDSTEEHIGLVEILSTYLSQMLVDNSDRDWAKEAETLLSLFDKEDVVEAFNHAASGVPRASKGRVVDTIEHLGIFLNSTTGFRGEKTPPDSIFVETHSKTETRSNVY